MPGRREKAKPVAIPAKISSPRLTEIYRRTRLFRALDETRRKRAIWITAPAGAGKTSVVTTYLSTRRLPALWYNVDARDGDVANLFHYLATAARVASSRRKPNIPVFKSENQSGVAAFARGFFEALADERPLPSVIVLDDYHEARSDLWDEVIREALCAFPTGLAAIIVSRGEPPPLFARLIAAGDINLLGPGDLRLTQQEMTALVHLYRPDLRTKEAKPQVERVCELADGWAAALTLLLQETDIAGLSPHGFEHRSERLFDYFATEILDKITPAEREFLLKTSIASSLTAKLAEHLTGTADAKRALRGLESRSFLTQRLGSSGSYRYHPLLRQFLLRQAARELGSEALRQLHRRAADTFLAEGLIDEAMEQLEAAQDVVARSHWILRVAPSYVVVGRSRTIERWIARLPVECVELDGWLSFWAAICCVDHSPSAARELLERAHTHFARDHDAAGLYRTCAAAIQAIVHEGMDFSRLDSWVERLDRMRVDGPACPENFLPMAATGMLIAYTFRLRGGSRGRYWAERALHLALDSDDVAHRVMTGGFLAFYFALHDDAARASVILEMLQAATRAAELSPLSVLTLLQADAVCSWVRGDNAGCLSRAREALALAARTGISVWNVYLQTVGVAAALSGDDAAASREFLDQLAQPAHGGPPFLVGAYYFNASWDALTRDDVAAALHGAELACQCADQVGYPLAQCIAHLAHANALFRTKGAPEALAALRCAREHAEDVESPFLLHGCDLLEADFLWTDDRARALDRLRCGLRVGRERNYHNMFCMSMSLMRRIAGRALEYRIEEDHVRESITKHRLAPESASARLESWPWQYRLRAFGSFEMRRIAEGGSSPRGASDRSRGEPRGRPLRLLCAIIAFGGREVAETSLIDALWPDADGDAGRRVFDTTLHRLRRQLGDDQVLRLTDSRIGLNEGLCWLDTWALEELLAETARQVQRAASISELLLLSRRLLEMYRGPLLADEPSASWARGPRERWAAKFEHAAQSLGRALEEQGEFEGAAALYQRTLDVDALAERACAGLMRCAAGTGHRAEAIRIFERYRAELAAVLDTVPGRELSELWAKLATEASYAPSP
jgi:LuxR family transcriptional regulator, maltose regulon positive regulatory protein